MLKWRPAPTCFEFEYSYSSIRKAAHTHMSGSAQWAKAQSNSLHSVHCETELPLCDDDDDGTAGQCDCKNRTGNLTPASPMALALRFEIQYPVPSMADGGLVHCLMIVPLLVLAPASTPQSQVPGLV